MRKVGRPQGRKWQVPVAFLALLVALVASLAHSHPASAREAEVRCAACALSHSPPAMPRPEIALEPPLSFAEAQAPTPPSTCAPFEPLAVAPKTSPPAAFPA
ncbi:MAG: hypothetical protein HY698_12705 [Deltaproteobacteria bacterium]|nr:hypothetical protein [Deltaproteobacteria bacterium]